MKRCFFVFLLCLTFVSSVFGATYYINFDADAGFDYNNGTSMDTPWKHCPGDSNAIGNPSSTTLQAGDNVYFKGGVKYRGQIAVNGSGSSGSPITFTTAPGWGAGKAIITAADLYSGGTWTACESQAACRNNPNWAHIYYSTLQAGTTLAHRLYMNNEFVYWSKDPDTATQIAWQQMGEWKSVLAADLTATTLTDANYFTQSDSSYWNDAYVGVWVYGNQINIKSIIGFNPATDTISFDTIVPPGGNSYYSVFNHPALIDNENEYAISPTDNKIYLWPKGDLNPNNQVMEVSNRVHIFSWANKNYITIDGLKFTGIYSPLVEGSWDDGIAVQGIGNNLTVKNCEFLYLSAMNQASSIYFTTCNDVLIENNEFGYTWTNRGPTTSGTNHIVRNNNLHDVNGTGIWFAGTTNGLIQNNILTNILGVHSNGIAAYQNSDGVIIEGNKVSHASTLATWQNSKDLIVRNNLFDGDDVGLVAGQGGMTGYLNVINNTIVNARTNQSGGIISFTSGTINLINNVIDGGGCTGCGGGTRSHNLYTSLAWNQNPGYGWYPGIGEVTGLTNADMFVDPINGDYHLLSDGDATNTGTNTLAYGVSTDIEGIIRPQSTFYDIGAYEYSSGEELDSGLALHYIKAGTGGTHKVGLGSAIHIK